MNFSTVEEIRELFTAKQISESDLTSHVNRLLDNNQFSDAFPILSFLTESETCSISMLMTAGLVAISLHERTKARSYFHKIIDKDKTHFDAQYNLALLELEENNLETARDIIHKLLELYPENSDLFNDLAVIYTQLDNIEEAYSSWEESLKINPNDSNSRNNALEFTLHNGFFDEGMHILRMNRKAIDISDKSKLEIDKWTDILKDRTYKESALGNQNSINDYTAIEGQKVAIFATIDTFVVDIARTLEEKNEVRFFKNGSAQEMMNLMEWSDVSWFEWCDQLLIEATKHKKTCQIVCRLHSYEAFTDMPHMVDWSKVDLLIFVNDSVRQIVNQKIKIDTKQIVIHNGLDVDNYTIPKEKIYGKKIASVGYINYKKNPALLLYCFDKIHTYDPAYTLHIAGEHQDPRIKLYFDQYLKETKLPVYFDGWIEDMSNWYTDKDFIISTSLFESFHYSIAEGMATGLLPLIHNWAGAKNIYPKEYLFNNPDDCLELLKRIEATDKIKLASSNRGFISSMYKQKDKVKEIMHALQSIMTHEDVAV